MVIFKNNLRKLSFLIFHFSFKKGFTLIELLVVIAIVGLLLSAILVIINPGEQLQKTRDTQRKRDLAQIQTALDAYHTDKNHYPDADISKQIYGAPWDSEWYPYMTKVPKDPIITQQYYYQVADDKSSYRLYAKLERCPDPQTIPDSCSEDYNYSVTSSNLVAILFSGPTPAPIPTSTPAPPTNTPGPATPTPTLPPPTPTPDPNLVGKWSFNDPEDPGKDSSGNLPPNNGTVNGATWKGPSNCDSAVGGCLQFDGVDDNVALPNVSALNLTGSFTIDARVKMAAFCTGGGCNGGIIYSNRDSCNDRGLDFSVGGPNGYLSLTAIGGEYVFHPQSIALNEWVRLSTTRHGTGVKLYINKAEVASGTITSIGNGSLPFIGMEPGCNTTGYLFKGLMDEVRIYNRALTAIEISNL